MADDVTLPGAGAVVATDEVAGRHFQIVKLAAGADGAADPVTSANPLPVAVQGSLALDAATLAALETINANTGGLTDAQLRAAAVPVSAAALPLPVGAATEATLATLAARTPALGAAAPGSSQPVTLPTDVTVGAAASIAALNTNLLTGNVSDWYDAANYHSASIQIIGGAAISAGAIFFEQTNDTTAAPSGNVWAVEEDTSLTPTPQIAAITIAASTVRMFRAPVTARYVRVRVSTAFAGGTVQAVMVASQLPYNRMVQTVHQATAASFAVDTELAAAAALADGAANPTTAIAGAAALLFNGSTWDRQRGNTNVTMGDTGAKTATFNGATQTNHNARGALVTLAVGTVSGTSPTCSVQLQVSYDGTNFLNLGPASTALTATGQIQILIYPTNASQTAGATPANLTSGATVFMAINAPLPRTWRLVYTIGGTTPSFTFTNAYAAYIL